MFNSKIDGLFVLETRPRLSSSRLGGVGTTRRHQHCELWNKFFCLDVSAAVTGVKDAPVFGSTRPLWVRGQTSPYPQSPTLGHELSDTVGSYYILHIYSCQHLFVEENTWKHIEDHGKVPGSVCDFVLDVQYIVHTPIASWNMFGNTTPSSSPLTGQIA